MDTSSTGLVTPPAAGRLLPRVAHGNGGNGGGGAPDAFAAGPPVAAAPPIRGRGKSGGGRRRARCGLCRHTRAGGAHRVPPLFAPPPRRKAAEAAADVLRPLLRRERAAAVGGVPGPRCPRTVGGVAGAFIAAGVGATPTDQLGGRAQFVFAPLLLSERAACVRGGAGQHGRRGGGRPAHVAAADPASRRAPCKDRGG